MKLYTEEDVLNMLRSFHNLEMNVQLCMLKLTPIELPSDEEINEIAMVVYGFNAKEIKDVLEYKAFKRGAKWMRNKIGGNK